MSGGPLTTWRCSDCGHELWNQVTAGAEFGISVQVLACPDPGCGGTPEIVALDGVTFDSRPAWLVCERCGRVEELRFPCGDQFFCCGQTMKKHHTRPERNTDA